MFTVKFWKDAGERAIATGVEAFAGFFVADKAFDIEQLDWKHILVAALVAALGAVGKSLIAATTGVKGTASLTKAVVPNPYTR